MIWRMTLAVLIGLLGSLPGGAAELPSLEVTDTAVLVTSGPQKLTASLVDGVLSLATPYGDYRFTVHIDQDSGWTLPSRATAKPVVTRARNSVRAAITYPVPDGRELELTIEAYRGVPAVFVTSRVRVLGDCRPEYYFWSWSGTFGHYFVPGESGPERRDVDRKGWSRFGFHDWVFLPAVSGGLAVLTTGTVGRAPGDGGEPYINALPRSGYIGQGRSLDVSFGIAGVKDASETAALWQLARKHRVGAIDRSPTRAPSPKIDYGKPAPQWLRDADLYNGFYHARPAWSRETIRDRFSDIPLIVGVPHDRAVVDRCHRAGVRVIPYVNYMELLNTRIEQEARGRLYYEWLQAADHDALDLTNHPDWVCIDTNGKDVSSIWGSNNGHPGLFYTCFHQQGLRDAALEQVRKLMEMGADGVFIDNAGPVTECFGANLGKHSHAEDAPNTRLYQRLQQDIYRLVKSFGEDRIVMANSGIIPDYWAWCDAQMWESCYCGAGTSERMHEWAEMQYAGELHAEAVRHGKVPVILSYLGDQPDDRRSRSALFTYAYSRLYGFLWADWFTLEKTEADRRLAKTLYATRLGKPTGLVRQQGKVFYREFEKGLVIVNPTASPVAVSVPTRLTSPLADIGHSEAVTPSNGRLKLEIAAESGRVLTVTQANGAKMNNIQANHPRPEHGLHYTTPATTWDEALPVANGILGGLVWGDGHPLKITLDRTDLWDLREIPEYHSPDFGFAQMRKWHEEGRHDDLVRVYEQPYHRPGPTKLPGGRIEIDLPESAKFESAGLDITNGVATVRYSGGVDVRVTIHAKFPVGLISIRGAKPKDVRLISPFGGKSGISEDTILALGYPPPDETSDGARRSYLQEIEGDAGFAAALDWSEKDGEWTGAWSIASSREHRDPLRIARLMAANARKVGFTIDASKHWWDAFWSRSSVTLPNKLLERQWYLEMYKLGAASRRGCPPITLQGPWTADGELPPWKGDYHHDMNTQLTYSAHYTANHLDEGLSFIDWLWDTRGNCENYTRRFYGLPGMNVPMTADLQNNQIGGWRQYAFSSTTAAWLAHQFYQHWRYSRDTKFLRGRAYPYLKEAATFIEALTAQKDESGKRTLPLSASPEINDNRPSAWFDTITNYDLALCRWLLSATAELADELKLKEDAAHWRQVCSEFPDFAYGDDGRLLVAKDYPMPESHRHFSHLLSIFPLETIRWDDGEAARRTMKATLAELEKLGTDWWCGYSFSWIAAVYALARDGESAEKNLETFAKAFCLRNSFHCNGDQSGKGYSKFTYRPFTLEGNLVAATAIQNMLLQSRGGRIRVFPAIPQAWKDVSFTTLRAQGSSLVSARRAGGVVTQVEITSEKGGQCTLVSPWTGRDITLKLKKGERVTLDADPRVK